MQYSWRSNEQKFNSLPNNRGYVRNAAGEVERLLPSTLADITETSYIVDGDKSSIVQDNLSVDT
jgi:hypothetical protein